MFLLAFVFPSFYFPYSLRTNPFDSFFINVTWNRTIGAIDQACGSSFCDDAFGFLNRSLISCVEKTIFAIFKTTKNRTSTEAKCPSARLMPSGPTAQLMTWAG